MIGPSGGRLFMGTSKLCQHGKYDVKWIDRWIDRDNSNLEHMSIN